MNMQALITALYPPQCLLCRALVDSEFGLCPDCWRDTPFISGLTCDKCGIPLPGQPDEAGPGVVCDDCLGHDRPWQAGRAALHYRDNGRKLVLALKHGDRLDLARPAAEWLRRAAGPLLRPEMLVVPVPLHWRRLIRRRYNQSALVSAALARAAGLEHCVDALRRPRFTGSQDGRTREGRFENMAGAITVHPRRAARLKGREVVIVDDVMTSGATFAAATEACHDAGAASVLVLSLARVAKEP
ncbi:double zinc ribbon domain-containing protein [Pseudogemmobacter sonorensis]|uniref:double zinc ribbon domain-containing protein n=1 Tax=Pseudogemmobacter sonorensis TaxID=2989681 RepID=UPI0036883379